MVELDDAGSLSQMVELPLSGSYELQIEHGTRNATFPLEDNAFIIFFNGKLVSEIRHPIIGVFVETFTVQGKKGKNYL